GWRWWWGRGGAIRRAGQLRGGDHRRALQSRRAGARRPRKDGVMAVDLRLYALVDPAVAGGRTLVDLARRLTASATLVQLRDKHGSTRAMIAETRDLRAVLEPEGIPLLVNDRVDVALAAEADGVHIGQDDMAVPDARLLLGRNAIIGLSGKTGGQAEAAPLRLLDYFAGWGGFGHHAEGECQAAVGPQGVANQGK